MSDERLKPCPFCGGEAEVITTKTRQGQTSSVRCSKCSCKVTILKPAFYDGDVEKDTVEHWNTRKPMERIVERLEKELELSDKEIKRCIAENPLQFEKAEGYATGIYNAIEIVKNGENDNE